MVDGRRAKKVERVATVALGTSAAAFLAVACSTVQPQASTAVYWPVYGGAPGDRYSRLTQINRTNVGQLQEVWRLETGIGGLQTSPLMVGGILYVVTPRQDVVALEAATGKPIWRWDAPEESEQPVRGLSLWTGDGGSRLFTSNGFYLVALDPATGRTLQDFGTNGRIDLREGLGRDPSQIATFLTSPGVIFDDKIIVGFRTWEGHPGAPGAVRAFDVRTGKLAWAFNLIPKPGEAGHDTWPADAWKDAGGANSWPGMVVDQARGIVFVPTGSPVDDFYGGDRIGDNLYSDSLVALDARNGRKLWHFQGVHHDVLDRDFPSPPVLVTVEHEGRRIDAVAQPSKQGFLFLFDRVTGKPLWPIDERPTPPSDVPGEVASPTQPHARKPAPYARQWLTEDTLTNRTPEARDAVLAQYRKMRSGGPFLPFTVGQDTIVFPGFDGGAEWGGPAVDRGTNIIYINSNEMAWLGALAENKPEGSAGKQIYMEQCSSCHGENREGSPPQFPSLSNIQKRMTNAQITRVIHAGKGRMPGFPGLKGEPLEALLTWLTEDAGEQKEAVAPEAKPRNPYRFTGYRRWFDPDGYPAVAPPWGTLNAIDLDTGDYVWRVPFGEHPELAAKGMVTGSENYGGPIVTAGGILIIGATNYDRKIRAFDAANGALLWQHAMPYSGNATPITYMVGGKQYVVIGTSGSRNPKGPQGSAYVAFALP